MTRQEFDYDLMVRTLFRNGAELLKELNPHRVNLMHAAVGISGEAGELLDAVKKNWAYGKPLDIENVVEELGDIEFYLQALRIELGITRDQTLEANKQKLAVRYQGMVFTPEAAIGRADKRQLIVDDVDIRYGEG